MIVRKQRHDKVQADPGPSQNQGLSEGTNGDLTTEFDTQQPSTDQVSHVMLQLAMHWQHKYILLQVARASAHAHALWAL